MKRIAGFRMMFIATCLVLTMAFLSSVESIVAQQPDKVADQEAALKAESSEESAGDEASDAGKEPIDQLQALQSVQEAMHLVSEDFASTKIAEENQQRQQQIIETLKKLLDQQDSQENSDQTQSESEKQSPKDKPEDSDLEGKKSKTDSDPSEGTDRSATKEPPLSAEMREKIWGHLPERVRERMRNIDGETFLPKYERLIRAYYERLANEISRD